MQKPRYWKQLINEDNEFRSLKDLMFFCKYQTRTVIVYNIGANRSENPGKENIGDEHGSSVKHTMVAIFKIAQKM